MEDRRQWVVETSTDATVMLRLDYPEKRNAFTVDMRLALIAALRRLDTAQDVRAIVLTGGPAVFCSGGDVSTMGRGSDVSWSERLRLASEVAVAMVRHSKPIVAAVEGWAVGAGFSLAMLCDTVVAGDGARFRTGFGDVGMIGDTGVLHTLLARVGHARARQLLLYGETVDAALAHRWGLVDALAPAGAAVDEALRLAALVARKAPLPVAMTKAILADGLESLLAREREAQAFLATTADHQEGMAAFLAKRPPRFVGR